MLIRKPDWQNLLDGFLREKQYTEFRYGSWDCCLFVCDAILLMTGTDPAATFRGRYASRSSARRALRELTGSRSVEAVTERVTEQLGMPEIAVSYAGRGDVALFPSVRDSSLGLIGLNGRDVITTSSQGLWRLPLSLARRAWQV